RGGSGIMGERLSGGNVAVDLLNNTLAPWNSVAARAGLHRGATRRGLHWRGFGTLHVRRGDLRGIAARPFQRGLVMTAKKHVLILCTGNSARSQMAEGLFRHEAGGVYEAFSAGTNPSAIRPEAIAV